MAQELQPLARLKLPTGPAPITPEQKYWKKFSSQLQLPSPSSSPITHISHPSTLPAGLNAPSDTFAITSGARVQIYSSKTRKLLKTISRFGVDDIARGGEIRRDGRVLVAGGESGAIQAFDINSRAILKTWREHKQPVWVTSWHLSELTTLMSCSDDKTVRLWDLPSESSTQTFLGHQDYVRSGTFMPGQASGLLVSGSYDQTVRLWDPRVGSKSVMTFKHSAAIEAVLPLPSGTTVVAAAENAISVLDLVAARPVNILKNHQKTITSLSLAGNGTRVVSGGLDGHVKIFETQGWNMVHGLKYPSPILSLSVIPVNNEDRHLAVGMQSGLLSIRTRLSGEAKVKAREREREMRALVEGKIDVYDRTLKKRKGKLSGYKNKLRGKDYTGEGADIVINGNDRGKIKGHTKWESALRKGMYGMALDLVLETKDRQNILTLLTALRHRSALRTALEKRDEMTLKPILKWLIKSIQDPRIIRITTDTAFVVLDLYAEHLGQSPEIDGLVERLHQNVRLATEWSQVSWSTVGMLEMLGRGNNEVAVAA